VADALAVADETGAAIELMNDPHEAVAGVDAIYTDAWTSMGWEHEAEPRAKIFAPYQVNEQLVAGAAPHAIFMHCLPAHRGEEITDAIMDCERSVVFDQAENRMHVQKAILLLLLGGDMGRLKIRSANA
jgi:ornithine carbamoyltransferase